MPRRLIYVLTVLTALLSGCGEDVEILSAENELQSNKATWERVKPAFYRFNLRRVCYCLPDYVREATVYVESDTVTQSFYADDGAISQMDYPNIDGLFTIIEKALASNAYRVDVSYHPHLGYPTRISLDYNEQIADDEISYLVDQVKIDDTIYANSRLVSNISLIEGDLGFKVQATNIVADDLTLNIESSGCGGAFYRFYASRSMSKSLPPKVTIVIQQGPSSISVCDGIFNYKVQVDLRPLASHFGQPITLINNQFSILYTPS